MQKNYFVKAFLVVLLFLIVKIEGFSQINASQGIPNFTNYIVGDLKVAGQQVWNVNQDKLGFIYAGTSSGLQKFDGRTWKLLTAPTREYNTNVRATLLSSTGIFYYGSLGDFGFVTNDTQGKTQLKSLINLLPEDILFNDIWSIQEVNGKIYFQAREAIFIYTPGSENQETSIRIWKPDTEFMYSFSLGDVYYSHQMSLGLFQEKVGILELIPGSEFLGQNRVQVLLPFKKPGEFLVGAFAGGLYHFDGKDFKPFPTQIDSLLQDRSLYKALALPDDTYALSVLGNGFFIIDQEGKVLSQFTTKNSITDQSVYSFHLDSFDNLWVGTNKGLSKIELFSPVTRFDSDEYEVGNVLSLNAYEDNLYIGTSTNVLYIDQDDGKIKQVEGFVNSQVFDLQSDVNQLLASGEGVYNIQGKKATVISGTENFNILKILISKSHPGYVFISGAIGIHVFKRFLKPSGEYQYEFIGPIAGADRYVYSLVEDNQGEIWGGTQAGILYRVIIPKTASGNLDVTNAKVLEFSENDGIRGLSGTAVTVNGKVYTSGIDGFYFFERNSARFQRDSIFSFSEEIADINLDSYGLGSNQFGDVFLDFKGEKRLAKLQADSTYVLQVYPFNLITASFTNSGFTEPSGVYWFGTDEGLLRIDPNKDYKFDHLVPLYFTSVTSGEESLDFPEYLGDNFPELEYKGNKISFNFIAPFFIKEDLMSYQTYLDGFDKDWEKWEDKTFREFTNLPFGTYTFRVRAKNIFNTISEEITFTFVILPPWYATWWAYILYFLAFGLLVFALVKIQSGRLVAIEKKRAQQKELEHAREIEEAYQNLKATQDQLLQQEKLASLGQLTAGIAHEIKNPLNFVNNFADVSMELIDDMREELENDNKAEALSLAEDIKSNLLKIHLHGTRADNIVKSMLLHSRGGSGKMELTDLNAMVQEFSNLAFHGMRATKNPISVDITLNLDESIGKIPLITDDFSRVILNLCNNAFDAMRDKLGDENQTKKYTPELTISTKSLVDGVEIIFADNGPGIPEEIQDKILQPFFTTKKGTEGTGLGLSITHDIIKRHNGSLSINSQLGKGTQFTIFLPKKT